MEESEQIYAFVSEKISLLQIDGPWSKRMLARLRRGVGKDPVDTPDIWEITFGGIPESLSKYKSDIGTTKAELAIHVALTLYSLHQQGNDFSVNGKNEKNNKNSFASASRKLIFPDGKNENAIKRRFDSLITALDLTEFSYHARGLVQMMRTADKPIQVNYPQLAKDLYFFQIPEGRRRVLLNWGRDFYRIESNIDNKKE
ncbi:MAG: type I-E CRISPR-associated protein Cse2/CasB [Candidatus Methanomethylophilaceae archaeon]|nr:type I-E CRISPR-associated protein Cse2/CasB [Candidatus Cloacimonadota bacterium]MCK9322338.1 type I-E CRISPR-associated protein Cse2/CasB [Candidatus Methanomethylophilaceae archaeon]